MAGFIATLSSFFGNATRGFLGFLGSVRDLPQEVRDGHLHMKGRTYVFVSAIVLATVTFSAFLAEGIDTWKDNEVRVGQQMLTSANASEPDMFEYLIDTAAGRTLVEGDVSTEAHCVTLPGDAYRGCFAAVEEYMERYVTRVEVYQCGTEKHPQTCTRTVSEWQGQGTDRAEASTAVMLDTELPYGFVRNNSRHADVDEVREPNEAGWFRSNDHYFYESDTVRYSYRVEDNNYYGTVWLNLSEDSIERIGGFWNGKTIAEVVEEHTDEPVTPNVIHWIFQILFILAALTGIVILVMRDLDDGIDHGF